MSNQPRIWSRFVAKEKKFRIQDMPQDKLDDVLELFINYYIAEEAIHKVAGITTNKEAVVECRRLFKELIKAQKSVLICCPDDNPDIDDDIIAASIMTVDRKEDPIGTMDEYIAQIKTPEMRKMFELTQKLMDLYVEMEELGVESLYNDRGLVVHPKCRGLGIALRMFNARRMVCKAEGIPLTGAWMTSLASQKAAIRDGWETVFETSFEKFLGNNEMTCNSLPPICKYMVATPI